MPPKGRPRLNSDQKEQARRQKQIDDAERHRYLRQLKKQDQAQITNVSVLRSESLISRFRNDVDIQSSSTSRGSQSSATQILTATPNQIEQGKLK